MINYAHNGASEYAPENTKSAFYLALLQGANGIETAVRRCASGELVLFCESELDSVSNGSGTVCERSLEDLKKLHISGNCPTLFYDTILTLREFLECFASYPISFALEIKEADLEKDILAMVREFGIADRTTITSFEFEFLKKVKEIDPSIRIGWLTELPEEKDLQALLAIGGEEICPHTKQITAENFYHWKEMGLSVCAWGMKGVRFMKNLYNLGVDAMSLKYPDRFCEYQGYMLSNDMIQKGE